MTDTSNATGTQAVTQAARDEDARGVGEDARGAGEDARGAGEVARGAGEDARGAGEDARGAGEDARGVGEREGAARRRAAVVWGSLGVLGFSFSLPATRLAVDDLDPTFVGLGRALVATLLAAALLALRREPMPDRADLPRFAVVGLGVVIGFPIATSLALKHLSSAHASVIVGMLPAATAALAVVRAGERPLRAFWVAAAAGLVAVLVFAATQGARGIEGADLLVLAAVALAALGYAEGGALSRLYGGWQVICWALVLTAPVLVAPVALAAARHGVHAGATAWLGFAYVSVVSMLLGFFAWYHGLALGGVAKIGQLQLAQPVLTLVWAALVLGERVTIAMVAAALAVLACVLATQRTRGASR